VTEPIIERLKHHGRFYRLETISHRYPHCWRCGTPLVFRLVDEWFISMGEVYDQARETLTTEQVDRSLRYQIMEVVDRIRWIPSFGHERELDWLLNMQDWMISKKRYWGLALPIYDCAACGTVSVVGGREELHERAIDGWQAFEGHTPHRPFIDAVRIACTGCGAPVSRIRDVGNPWLDAGIVPFSTIHFREDPDYWARWFPADFITESFPGQFRNWFYSMLAMSTVLRREEPFKTIFGYALVFGEDGRQMSKSGGNAIEFDEAADRMGVDVMRWMYAKARPEDNILFGWHAADEARRELLVLWNVYAFFVTYARLAGWRPDDAQAPPVAERHVLDRWLLTRAAGVAAEVGRRLDEFDAAAATRALSSFVDDLSTWYLRLSRRRFSRAATPLERGGAFATLHAVLVATSGLLAPILPFLAEWMYDNLTSELPGATDSVHLTAWPTARLSADRDEGLETSMAIARRAVELTRTLRSSAKLRSRQPLAAAWLAVPGRAAALTPALLELVAAEANVHTVTVIDDESDLVERRVKPLLPRIGKRLGGAIPAVMAAARAGAVEFLPDGGIRLAGVELAADEVEIQAAPRPGTAVAADDGLVVVLDTSLTDELRLEGDAREIQRAIQELRRTAGLELDDHIRLWLDMDADLAARLGGALERLAADTLADELRLTSPPDGATAETVEVSGGRVGIGLERLP
jgi:isoleucyl-tRNA synthetase